MSVSSVQKYAALYADQATLEVSCGGYGTAGFQIGGTWVGTLTFEVTVDHGVWQSLNVTKTNSTTQVTTATANGVWSGPISGMQSVRLRFSTYGSGTAQVQILISEAAGGSGSGGGGGGGGGTSSDFDAAFPAAGTAAGFLDSLGNMAPAEVTDDGELKVAGTFSIGGVGPTGDPVPADAIYVGVGDENGDLAGLRSVVRDLNSTTPPVVPVSGFFRAGPGAGGPVVLGTTTNPDRIAGTGAAGTAATGVVTVQGIASMTPVQVSQATASNLNATVVGTGTFATQAVATGNVADGSSASGNPVRTGALAKSPDGTDPGAVAEGQVAATTSDLNRRHFVNTRSAWTWSYHSDGSSALTDASVQADPGDGFQIVVTEIIFSTGAATACNIFFEEGSTKVLGPWYLEAVAGRGVVWQGEKKITASTALTVTTSASIAQSLDVQGYIQAV